MLTNLEILREALKVVRGKWFWRIVVIGSILYCIAGLVSYAISSSYSDMGVQTWLDFLQAKLRAARSGLGYSVPSVRVFWQMTGASAFHQFFGWLFGSILMFGMAGVLLKAVRNDENDWFAGAFGGFRRPLELTWLMVLMNILVFLWTLLFVIPGLVALYRYRQAWYLKSENPDWSARKCLAESGRMMRGRKGQAFCLDLVFVGLLLLWCVLGGILLAVGTVAGKVHALAGALVGLPSVVFCFGSLVFLVTFLAAARAVFYEALAKDAAHTRQGC